jgi:hypothetical protein
MGELQLPNGLIDGDPDDLPGLMPPAAAASLV